MPSLSSISLQSLKPPSGFNVKSKSTRQKNFEDARIGLAKLSRKTLFMLQNLNQLLNSVIIKNL